MKKVLFIALLFLSLNCGAQVISTATVSLKVGTAAYVTINGQDYPRSGYLRFTYYEHAHDTAFGITYSISRLPLLEAVTDTMFYYADSTNKKARNAAALRAWLRTNAY